MQIFLILFYLLFISGCTGSSLCAGCSLVAAHRLLIAIPSLVAECRLLGTQASITAVPELQNTGSVAVMCVLRCSTACGIFLDQGSNLRLLHWQADSLPLSYQGNPVDILKKRFFFMFDIDFFFNCSVVDLQCCANFCCIAKWLSYTHTHVCIHSVLYSFPYGLSQDTEYSSLC